MRFPTNRKLTRSGRVAGLLALSSALFSTVKADPCQEVYKAVQNGDGTGYFSSKLAHACLKALPLNEEYAKQTADALLPIHEIVSYQTYFKNPPTPELEIPPHDGVAEIKKIQENVKKGHYKNLYDFSTDVYKVFTNYRDGHTRVNPWANSLFFYAHPYSIVSVADKPTEKPKIWTLTEDRKLDKEVTKIDGQPVAEYLHAYTNSTLEHYGFADPDTRYNILFAQFPTVAPQENMGFFQYVQQYPGKDKFTFTFADGSTQEVDWSARLYSEELLVLFKEGANAVANYCWYTDEEWEQLTPKWTEEEAIQYATENGWAIVDELKSSQGETKSAHTKGDHRVQHPPKPKHGNGIASHQPKKGHHGTTKPHPKFSSHGQYRPNGRERPHKRDMEAMRRLYRKLKKRSNHEDEVEDEDYVEEDDYVEDEPTYTPDDDTETDVDTPDTSGQEPGFPEYFNTTSDGYFRFYSLDGETAVLDISSFAVDDIVAASDLVDYGLDYVHSTGHKHLIIDLTNNGGGAAFLPFDLTRTLFPDTWKFESVNMRYTKAGYASLKNWPLGAFWTVEGKDWNSLDDLYTPVKRDGDTFTQMFKYDHLQITEESGHGVDPTQKQFFSKDNIVVLSNGYCGSACFAWWESLYQQGVRGYAMGGRPNGSKYMQTSGGVKGGILYSIEDFTALKSFYGAFEDEEAQKIAEVLPGPIRLALRSNGLNAENQFRNGEEDQLPLEFRYTPACKRFTWTKEMMVDTGATWKFIREQAWDKHGKPTGCEKEYVEEKPYKHGKDAKKNHHPSHADSRVPQKPPKKGHHADVTPTPPKHGSGKPKHSSKEHKAPHPKHSPQSGSQHKKNKGVAGHKPVVEHYKGKFRPGHGL